MTSNPNVCPHGYRIETSICPVSGCIANTPGPRIGDTGPVLACGPPNAPTPVRVVVVDEITVRVLAVHMGDNPDDPAVIAKWRAALDVVAPYMRLRELDDAEGKHTQALWQAWRDGRKDARASLLHAVPNWHAALSLAVRFPTPSADPPRVQLLADARWFAEVLANPTPTGGGDPDA